MKISGKYIDLRTVVESDAHFIFTLRQDREKTKYLSSIQGTVQDQIDWIRKYKIREAAKKEYYFIIESKSQESLGLVRIYDFKDDSFSWGSWLIKDNAPKFTAIESALLIYQFAFDVLKFTQSHFEVQKGNDKVIAFHQRFGAEIVEENKNEYFFIMKKTTFNQIKLRYKRFL